MTGSSTQFVGMLALRPLEYLGVVCEALTWLQPRLNVVDGGAAKSTEQRHCDMMPRDVTRKRHDNPFNLATMRKQQ